jgi:thioredoxin 1
MGKAGLRVDDNNFKTEVLDSKLPVLVDFWATWCTPCAMVAPAVEEIAKQYEGRLKVCTVDLDEAPAAASRYEILSIPTLVVFKNGSAVARTMGALPRSAIESLITPHL